jgi:hypothetical protein
MGKERLNHPALFKKSLMEFSMLRALISALEWEE